MCITPAAFPAFCSEKPLARLGEIEHLLRGFRIEYLRTYGNFDDDGFAVFSKPVRTFPMVAAFRFVLGVISEMEQRIESLVCFHPYISPDSSIAAGWPPTRHEFLAAKRSDAVPTVSGFNFYLRSIYEHFIDSTQL
jgi:hypothetical protein